MKKFLYGLLLGIILGVGGFWYVQNKLIGHPAAQQQYLDAASKAGTAARETAANMSDALKAKLETLGLSTDKIKEELARSGQVVRRKAEDIGDKAADVASDARAVTEIKAKFAMDSNLSAWKISVACDQGRVTLSGTVSAPEDIGKAIALALEADGVRDVASTLKVESK